MSQRLPPFAYVLGLAGLIPFAICAVAALAAEPQQSIGVKALIGYGAVTLSFLGAIHWGLALSQSPSSEPTLPEAPSINWQLLMGVIPALIGWLALIFLQFSVSQLGLATLIAGYIATAVIEQHWSKFRVMPNGYMAMRWVLTVLVVTILTTVLALRSIGAMVIL